MKIPRPVALLTLAFVILEAIIFNLGFLTASLASLVLLLYTSNIASRIYKGKLVSAITTSLNLLSAPTFFALLPTWEGASPYFKPVSYSILLGVSAYSLFLIINSVSESYKEIIYPASKSILLLLIGLDLWSLSDQIIPKTGIWGGVGYFVLSSFSGMALLSFSDVFKNNPDKFVSLAVDFLRRNRVSRSIIVVLASAYIFVGRAILLSVFPHIQAYLIVAEWGALSALALRSYLRFKGFVETEYVKPDQVESWSRHTPITNSPDQGMEFIADSIQSFLSGGIKGPLVVSFIGLMRDVGEHDDGITSSLSPLIEYEDLRPGVVFHSSQVRYIDEKNRERRLAIFTETLKRLSIIGLNIQLPEGKLVQRGKKVT